RRPQRAQGGHAVRRHRRLRRLLPKRGRGGGALAHERAVLPARRRAGQGLPRRGEAGRPAGAEGPSRGRRHARLAVQRDAGGRRAGAGGFHDGFPVAQGLMLLQIGEIAMATKPKKTKRVSTAESKPAAKPDLSRVREQIDGIDRRIQELIAERAQWAQQVGKAKGKLAAAVDYYRPEREAQVLRRVVDRNDGPLSDEVLVRLFREVMSACLAQQEPLKIGYLGPEGTFSQQAVFKHFGHSAHGLPLASIEEVFQEVAAGNADFGVVPVENSGQGTIQVTLDLFLTS